MRFIAGFVSALVLICLAVFVVVVTGAYNVAATAPHTKVVCVILTNMMRNSVIAHAGSNVPNARNEDQVRQGFQEFDEMCTICHGAPGKQPTDIQKGLLPKPPDLAEAVRRWNSAQLFWIIKNGIKMTGMPAFGPTHSDDNLWNIVAFVQRLPGMSSQDYSALEKLSDESIDPHHPGENEDHHRSGDGHHH